MRLYTVFSTVVAKFALNLFDREAWKKEVSRFLPQKFHRCDNQLHRFLFNMTKPFVHMLLMHTPHEFAVSFRLFFEWVVAKFEKILHSCSQVKQQPTPELHERIFWHTFQHFFSLILLQMSMFVWLGALLYEFSEIKCSLFAILKAESQCSNENLRAFACKWLLLNIFSHCCLWYLDVPPNLPDMPNLKQVVVPCVLFACLCIPMYGFYLIVPQFCRLLYWCCSWKWHGWRDRGKKIINLF